MSVDHVPASLQRRVRERAASRCEYCGIAQAHQDATFHIDHVVPRRAGGATELDNLALACVSCSLRKGARETATDPEGGAMVPLFHPRRAPGLDPIAQHPDGSVTGLTPTGRATVAALQLNRPLACALRRALLDLP